METFKPGEVVKLKSGGDPLTVMRVYDVYPLDVVKCDVAWFANGELRTSTVPCDCLVSDRRGLRWPPLDEAGGTR